ncbi:hypothetical protein Hdeb2414_s0008g00274041 [Helianthus debilis subsp. tardiflorus]
MPSIMPWVFDRYGLFKQRISNVGIYLKDICYVIGIKLHVLFLNLVHALHVCVYKFR